MEGTLGFRLKGGFCECARLGRLRTTPIDSAKNQPSVRPETISYTCRTDPCVLRGGGWCLPCVARRSPQSFPSERDARAVLAPGYVYLSLLSSEALGTATSAQSSDVTDAGRTEAQTSNTSSNYHFGLSNEEAVFRLMIVADLWAQWSVCSVSCRS